MAQRDPAKTARNKMIAEITKELRAMLPQVLNETRFKSESSINATIGGKAAEFIDLQHELILSADQYVNLYMAGFKKALALSGWGHMSAHHDNYEKFKKSKIAQEYFMLFLKRSYLKHFDELSRIRPHISEAEIWIGQNKAEYGLFVAPRFSKAKQQWENDKSEIRHFPKHYWTIGHVLRTGLVIPSEDDTMTFSSVDEYLKFFKNVLVRPGGSVYEKAIATRYIDFVTGSDDPEAVPLLIPEYRFGGIAAKHKYRLDFTVIDPFTMRKVGFELSPWSTHGYLSKTKGLTQAQINEMAKDNFEQEMTKHKSFFKHHNIYSLIYTDTDLADMDAVFSEIEPYLTPLNKVVRLDHDLLNRFFI